MAQDIKVVRTLLAHHADANMIEHGTRRTALHMATLANWLEGVDALLAPGVDCQVRSWVVDLEPPPPWLGDDYGLAK